MRMEKYPLGLVFAESLAILVKRAMSASGEVRLEKCSTEASFTCGEGGGWVLRNQ